MAENAKNSDNLCIAGNLHIGDWRNLKLSLKPNIDKSWDVAFDFFERRINTRYINPILAIQQMGSNEGEGFAIVNLQCSLIETIESFYQGWIYDINKKLKGYYFREVKGKPLSREQGRLLSNQDIFVSFFNEREPFIGKIDGIDFYQSVRCGLLHETQTKNGWRILGKHSDTEIFFMEEDNCKIIYRTNLQFAIQKVIDRYKKAIVGINAQNKTELRENFIAKFDRICELSKPKS